MKKTQSWARHQPLFRLIKKDYRKPGPPFSLHRRLRKHEQYDSGSARCIDQNPLSPTFGQNYPSQKYNDHGWNAQLRQSVFNPTTWFAVGSASSSVQAAQHEFKSQQQELIIRVLQAYLNILRAQDRLDTTKAEITAVKRQLEQVQQRFDVGLVAITDVLDSQAAYDNAVVRGIQAEGDYAISFETLSTLTGRSYESLNRLDESLPIVDPNPRKRMNG